MPDPYVDKNGCEGGEGEGVGYGTAPTRRVNLRCMDQRKDRTHKYGVSKSGLDASHACSLRDRSSLSTAVTSNLV
jgi:hypothetical protein